MKMGKKQKVMMAIAAALLSSVVSAETVTWSTMPSNAIDDVDGANPMTFGSDTSGFGSVDLTGFRIGRGGYGTDGGIEQRAAERRLPRVAH